MSESKRKKLPREFWAVNASNLFERGAYYGMLAVFSYHLHINLGIEMWIVGILSGISMTMINFLPLVSTALASKYGFKKLLLLSYTTLGTGYVVLGFGHVLPLIALAVVIMGLGSGFEKALIAASISHSADKKNRDYAFNIYYWVINIGAFMIPLSLYFIFVPENYGGVFFLMALFIVCSFLIILLAYRNPIEPDPTIPASKAVKNLTIIFKDRRFLYVLLIFSGCWFMLYTRQPFMPVFMVTYDILPDWFIPFLAALNPGTIIALGPLWAYIIKDRKIDSLKMLITGILIVSFGFILAGFSTNPVFFIIGLVTLSFGELVSYPAFLTYVSKIPPEEDRSIYMGYSFLPLAIAGTLANFIGGFLYYYIADLWHMGSLFWAIIASVGLTSASAFMHYERKYNRKDKTRVRPSRKPSLVSGVSASIPILLIPVVLLLSLTLAPGLVWGGGSDDENWNIETERFSFTGTLDEGDGSFENTTLPTGVTLQRVYLNLSWEDEPDIDRVRTFENEGDTFEANIFLDGQPVEGGSATNPHGEKGEVDLVHEPRETDERSTEDSHGPSSVGAEIRLVSCGDLYPASGPGPGFISIEDTSNSYELELVVIYSVPA